MTADAMFIGIMAVAGDPSRAVPALYALLSLVTFAVYAIDKSAAVHARRRIPEVNLHLLALAGGWPGALAAQRLLRHKSRKRAFLLKYWLTVALNCAALACLASAFGRPG